jgi:hypothetical protein
MPLHPTPIEARRIETAPELYRALVGGEGARFAVVRGARRTEEVEAYLPNGYALCESFEDERGRLVVIIGGKDEAGWTLDGYVIPRLASGLLAAQEIPA